MLKAFGTAVRGHWGIENKLHCRLDIAFREDESRIRKRHTPDTFGVIRHICLNLLKHETSYKKSLQAKRYRAARYSNYGEKILFQTGF